MLIFAIIKQKMAEKGDMNIMGHLEELRWRLVKSVIAVLIVAVVIWWFQEWIMDHIFMNLKSPDFISFHLLCKYFHVCIDEIPIQMHSNSFAGQFTYAIWMSLIGGFVVAFPYVFYQLWEFVRPGLKQTEVKAVKGIVFYVSILFFTGILFGYFVIAPLTVQFFGTYQISKSILNFFTINNYMSTIISTVFYSGLLFLLPMVIYIFAKLGIITSSFLKKYRKHAIVIVLALAAVITPPDVISQVIVSIPILILYEIGVYVAKRIEKKQVTA